MKSFFTFTGILSLIFLLAGCTGADARRAQRWSAFEPLRPDPEFRLLPDRPHLKFHQEGSNPAKGADSKPGDFYVEPPAVWKSEQFDALKIDAGASKFFPNRFEQYMIFHTGFTGSLVACALNTKMEEIGRAVVPVDRKAEEAGWIAFEFPGKFSPNEVKVIVLEPLR